MTTAFPKHRALDRSTDEIRLMKIHGGSEDDDAITCSLETVKLRDANPFYALSYVWGPDTVGGRVLVDGEEVHIRRNLWLFLRSLRNRFCGTVKAGGADVARRTIRVWADYTCVQQSDSDERNYQVSIMGDIYRSADAVYAWLGESQSPHDDGMRCIDEIGRLRAQNRPWIQISRGQSSIDARLSNITSSTYWSRVWIKQEVLLGKDVWFFFGLDAVNWRDVQFAATLKQENYAVPRIRRTSTWSSKTPTAPSSDSFTGSKQAMVSLLNSRAMGPGKIPLPELIAKFHNAGCQDGRDRIFALLSLTDIETKQQVVVDYRKPLLQVLLENYRHWTGEHVSWRTLDTSGKPNPHYQFAGFCSQIARMLPSEDLESLRRSETLRQAVTVRGIFTTSVPSEISSVCVIAVADCARIRPLSNVQELDLAACGFVLQVSMRPLSGRLEHGSDHFIYATSTPRDGDLIARLGQRVFFLRRQLVRGQSRQNSEECQLDLFATGTEIFATSLTSEDDGRLSTKFLQHPCLWMRQQLRDAIFEMVVPESPAAGLSKPPQEYSGGLQVVCNAAAIVTFLTESRLFEESFPQRLDPELDEAVEETLGEAEAEAEGGIAETPEKEVSELWSPYVFGVQHQVLMACRTCKTMGRSMFSVQVEGQECECMWDAQLMTPV